MITYAIDPGKHETSVAVGTREHGLSCIFRVTSESIDKIPVWRGPSRKVILEVPRVYPKDVAKANDLIDEVVQGSIIAGRISERTGAPIVIVHPNTTTEAGRKGWKGQVCKPVHHERIIKALTPAELAILLAIKPDLVAYVTAAVERYSITRKVSGYKAAIHNDLDAVGMLLEDAGRMK